ncbi:MAG: hypothetical protein ACFB8W_21085 [Elainellaceae cyanobacterium]
MTSSQSTSRQRPSSRRSFQAQPMPPQPSASPDDSFCCPCCGMDAHVQSLGQRYGKRSLPSYGDLVNDWLGRSPKTRRGERLTAPPRDPVGLGCVAIGGILGAAAIGAASIPVLSVTVGVTAYARHRVMKRYSKVYAPEYRKWARSLHCERCDLVFQPDVDSQFVRSPIADEDEVRLP